MSELRRRALRRRALRRRRRALRFLSLSLSLSSLPLPMLPLSRPSLSKSSSFSPSLIFLSNGVVGGLLSFLPKNCPHGAHAPAKLVAENPLTRGPSTDPSATNLAGS